MDLKVERLAPWTRPRVVILTILSLLLLFSWLKLHGYSSPLLGHWLFETSLKKHVILGNPQGIRSDDFRVSLPAMAAQAEHTPPLPTVNDKFGDGQDLSLMDIPAGWPTIFRPQLWGFVFGADFGQSWHWWWRIFAVWTALYSYAWLATRQGFVALGMGAAAVSAPLLVFFSYNCASHIAYSVAAATAASAVILATTTRGILGAGVILALCGAAFAFAIYPPYQIALAYVAALGVLGLVLVRRPKAFLERPVLKISVIIAAVVTVAGILAAFMLDHQTTIAAMSTTEYPGQRDFVGGGSNLITAFRGNILAHASNMLRSVGAGFFGNNSEQGAFILSFPVLCLWALFEAIRDPRPSRFAPFIPAAGAAFFMLFMTTPLPAFLTRTMLLSQVPPSRAIIAVGVADLMMIVLLFANPPVPMSTRVRRIALGSLAIIWGAAMLYLGLASKALLPTIGYRVVLIAVVTGVMFVVSVAARNQMALLFLAVVSMAGNFWFNPVVRGGLNTVISHPFTAEVKAIDQKHQGCGWMAYGSDNFCGRADVASAWLRIVGLKTFSGTQFVPDQSFWQKLDPKKDHSVVWNRFAHVIVVPPKDEEFTMSNPHPDQLQLAIDPRHKALVEKGIHCFVADEMAIPYFDKMPEFKRSAYLEGPKIAVYERNL